MEPVTQNDNQAAAQNNVAQPQNTMPAQQINGTELADPIMRVVAALIDGLLIGIPLGIVLMILGVFSSFAQDSSGLSSNPLGALGGNIVTNMISAVILFVAFAVYFVYVQGNIWKGQTLGKKLMNIKVQTVDGNPVDTNILLKRYSIDLGLYAIYIIPILGGLVLCCGGLIYWIALLVTLFSDQKHMTIRDKMANTVVVKA